MPPAGVNEVALNELGPEARVTRIPPPAKVLMTTPDDLAWRLLVEELAVPLLVARGGCDGADAHPAAITSAETPSIARQKMQTMRRSG